MVGYSTLFAALAAVISPSIATRIGGSSGLRILTDFPNGTWVENMAVRGNGQILVTLITQPRIFQVDPTTGIPPVLIHEFTQTNGTVNVVEMFPDFFTAIVADIADFPVPGSYQAWTIDLTSFDGGTRESVTTSKIADLSEGSFLNGMVALNPTTVLIGDSDQGVVYSLNIETGERNIVLDDPLMKTNNSDVTLGINGMRLSNTATSDFLFFENTGEGFMARVPINPDGTAAGVAEVVADTGTGDDFDLDRNGNAFVAVPNELRMVNVDGGVVKVVAGAQDETILAGCTSVRFGRGGQEGNTVFVSTNGGQRNPANGIIVPGHVVAVDLAVVLPAGGAGGTAGGAAGGGKNNNKGGTAGN